MPMATPGKSSRGLPVETPMAIIVGPRTAATRKTIPARGIGALEGWAPGTRLPVRAFPPRAAPATSWPHRGQNRALPGTLAEQLLQAVRGIVWTPLSAGLLLCIRYHTAP